MARRRRTLPEPGAGSFTDIQPDPSRVGGVAEAPFVRLPDPAALFRHRAERLRVLAPGHVMADYLLFLARIVDAQRDAVAALPAPGGVPEEQLRLRAEHKMPPISDLQVARNPDLLRTLDHLLAVVDLAGAPEQARDALDALRGMETAERSALLVDLFAGAVPLDRVGEALFAAAALQVHLAQLAAQLQPARIEPPADGVCPVCGGPPVASVVVGWTQASKARYCACSLCGTLWNHVRIKCTACGSTEGISYYGIEDGPQAVGVETCTACRSYIKHFQQHDDPAIDPVADDVASYALDLLTAEQEFRRSGFNPLFLTG